MGRSGGPQWRSAEAALQATARLLARRLATLHAARAGRAASIALRRALALALAAGCSELALLARGRLTKRRRGLSRRNQTRTNRADKKQEI